EARTGDRPKKATPATICVRLRRVSSGSTSVSSSCSLRSPAMPPLWTTRIRTIDGPLRPPCRLFRGPRLRVRGALDLDAHLLPGRANHRRALRAEQPARGVHGGGGRDQEVGVAVQRLGERKVPDLARLHPRLAAEPDGRQIERVV